MKKTFAILLAALMLLALCACGFGNGGNTGENAGDRPTKYDGQNSIEAIIDYADRLEAAGNEEAAAIVRSHIPQAASGEANQKIEEFKQENEDLQIVEVVEDAVRIANAQRGDD